MHLMLLYCDYYVNLVSGRSAAWLARHVRDVEVLGSNPSAPTIYSLESCLMMSEPLDDTVKRVHILYSGRVQGVGFRFTFREIALRLGVKGYVRNLPDGSVEAVCESSKDTLDLLVKNVSDVMSRYIISAKVTLMPYTGEFDAFSILV